MPDSQQGSGDFFCGAKTWREPQKPAKNRAGFKTGSFEAVPKPQVLEQQPLKSAVS
jgi:hypothetical protein